MTAALREELKQWLERLKREEALDPERYRNSGMLLLPNGLAVEPVLIRKKFLKWQDAHPEFPRIVFHGLRHSSATYQLMISGGDIKAVQGTTGHATADMLVNTYAHIQQSSRVELGRKFEEGFYAKQENPSPQTVPAAGEPTISMTALLELLKNADPEVKAQLRLGHIQLTEAEQPKPDELFFHLRFCQPFLCNAGLQFLPLLFQSFQPLLGGAGQNAHLDGVQHIGDADFRFPQLLFVDRQVGALLILQFHNLGDNCIHGSVIFHQLHGLVDHQIFRPLFPHCLFIAGLFLLGSNILIIGVHLPGVADTAFSERQRTALAAVQLGSEQIGILCLM